MWSGDASFRLKSQRKSVPCLASYREDVCGSPPTANVEWSHSAIASLIEQWQKHPCLFTDAQALLEPYRYYSNPDCMEAL